jgi:hypothetical protein
VHLVWLGLLGIFVAVGVVVVALSSLSAGPRR